MKNLIELIRVAIGRQSQLSHILTEEEWIKLYSEAKKQSLVGICFTGIEVLPKVQFPKMDLLMDWLGQTEYLKSIHGEHVRILIKLHQYLKINSFHHVFMKGLICGCRYPNPELRSCGDIDFVIGVKYSSFGFSMMP